MHTRRARKNLSKNEISLEQTQKQLAWHPGKTNEQHARKENMQTEEKQKQTRKKESNEEILEKWQRRWDNSEKGRNAYQHCREIGLDRIPLSKKGAQLITGHGNTRAYLKRIGKSMTDNCTCDLVETENKQHILYRCTLENRKEARHMIQNKYGNLEMHLRQHRKMIKKQVDKANEWALLAIEDDDYEKT